MGEADPVILTAAFDPRSARVFQDLRDRHFPSDRNIVPAHLTLFHALPGTELRAILEALEVWCARETILPFASAGLRFLGRGVAIEIQALGLVVLRKALAVQWSSWLTRQDAQGFRPHVTVQNKVSPSEARTFRDELAAGLPPLAGTIVGLDLWHYRGGPWEHAGRYGFSADEDNP